ncbi:COG2426 family protein [Clostridium formicaceticum]|uniref:Ligand-binding protein SH3 n=1 Tax=Clostridium formicaceticum TaxID=1497 RepID=A0AAC9RH50_9CLOT|nr:small multi-drug export protein [Clostridium formicaceticum]AOY75633.1 ligand-binding protein SH3 [Clostridium formicaceticum]ARE85946.1 Putative small multi-drug export protein [Clostridium formicaceticum]
MEKILEIVTHELMVLLIAAMPLVELRGAIPIGVSLGMHPIHATVLGIVGSLIPVPFLLIFVGPMFNYLRRIKLFYKVIDNTVKKTLKRSKNVKKYSIVGLMLFVAIPLPTTGIWSGCLAAILLNIPFRYAFPAIAMGATIAGTIMFLVSYAVILI